MKKEFDDLEKTRRIENEKLSEENLENIWSLERDVREERSTYTTQIGGKLEDRTEAGRYKSIAGEKESLSRDFGSDKKNTSLIIEVRKDLEEEKEQGALFDFYFSMAVEELEFQ